MGGISTLAVGEHGATVDRLPRTQLDGTATTCGLAWTSSNDDSAPDGGVAVQFLLAVRRWIPHPDKNAHPMRLDPVVWPSSVCAWLCTSATVEGLARGRAYWSARQIGESAHAGQRVSAEDRHPGIEAGSGYRPGFDLELHLNDSLGDCR
jgi:hypothetical protein